MGSNCIYSFCLCNCKVGSITTLKALQQWHNSAPCCTNIETLQGYENQKSTLWALWRADNFFIVICAGDMLLDHLSKSGWGDDEREMFGAAQHIRVMCFLEGNFLKMLYREFYVTMALLSLLFPLIVPIKRPVCYIWWVILCSMWYSRNERWMWTSSSVLWSFFFK